MFPYRIMIGATVVMICVAAKVGKRKFCIPVIVFAISAGVALALAILTIVSSNPPRWENQGVRAAMKVRNQQLEYVGEYVHQRFQPQRTLVILDRPTQPLVQGASWVSDVDAFCRANDRGVIAAAVTWRPGATWLEETRETNKVSFDANLLLVE